VIGNGACAFFRTDSFAAAAQLVQPISQLPGVDQHDPDVDLRGNGVTVRLITSADDYFGMRRDIDLAHQISVAGHRLGLWADPSAVQSVLVIPGAPDIGKVMPFWRATLGYTPRSKSYGD
jgi:4a-hydroxytetrahydrobiopterin dehydratase